MTASRATPARAEPHSVVYYALGGGHGHVLRGLATLERLGAGTLIGPARLTAWAAFCGVRYVSPPEPVSAGWIAARPVPDLLLVDVFPRGVLGELAPWLGRGPAWLVSRRVLPAYYLSAGVRDALESAYERVVWTEEPAPALEALAVPQLRIPPVLLRAPVATREDSRMRLGVPEDARLVLGLGSGACDQQARVYRLLQKMAARVSARLTFVSDELPDTATPPGPSRLVRHFPAASLLGAADVVVAAGGYHAFHETRATGVPTVFMPQRRRYDDQAWRVRNAVVARDPVELEHAVRAMLDGRRSPPSRSGDGAGQLAALVRQRVTSGRRIATPRERGMQADVLAEEEIAAMT